MQLWLASLGALFLFYLGNHGAGSCGCYGPASSPDKETCRCQHVKNASQLYTAFTSNVTSAQVNYGSPEFTVHPQSGTHVKGITVTLFCNITYNSTLAPLTPLSITWEHNATTVNIGPTSSALYSTLTISQFSFSSQGSYLCRVNNGNFTIKSRTATLQLPKFFGWIDNIYEGKSQVNSITITTLKGGSVILECLPNTTESLLQLSPTWTNSNSSAILLSSGNILLLDVQQDMEFKCYWPLRPEQRRSFKITSTELTTKAVTLVVAPKEGIIAAGTRVSLYCIAESNSTISVRWSKDGAAVARAVIRGYGQVLEIESATPNAAGNYTCTVSSGFLSINSTASVYVVEQPTEIYLSVSGANSSRIGKTIYIPMNPTNTFLTLYCHVETNSMITMQYKWLFRGEMLLTENQGPYLEVPVLDPWKIIGTYQCIAWNIAREISTSVQVVPRALNKPNPPTKVWIRKNTLEYFRYDIIWMSPTQTDGYTIHNYTVETLLVFSQFVSNFCCCIQEFGDQMFPFQAGCSGFSPPYTLYYRVAANTDIGQSNFVNGYNGIEINEGIPPTESQKETMHCNDTNHTWHVELEWTYRHVSEYDNKCYLTKMELKCSGREPVVRDPVTSNTYTTEVPCCTQCTWRLDNMAMTDSITSSISSNFSTAALKPSQPPKLLSVNRLGNNGTTFSISYQLPEDDAACLCGLSSAIEVTVQYSNATSVYQISKTVSFRGQFSLTIHDALCWAPYNISLAFNNTKGMSNFSEVYTIEGVTNDDILMFAQKPLVTKNSTDVTVTYELNSIAICLLSRKLVLLHICSRKQDIIKYDCTSPIKSMECHNITAGQGHIILPRYVNYCLIGPVFITSNSHFTINSTIITIEADEGTPSSPPRDVSLKVEDDELILQWKAPLSDSWNGIPSSFNIRLLRNGEQDSTNVSANLSRGTTYMYSKHFQYHFGTKYNVTISACTKIGCGPVAINTVGDDESTPEEGSNSSNQVAVIAAVVPSVLLITVLIVVLAVCFYYLCRKKKAKHPKQMSEESSSSSEESDDEPLCRDDLIPLSGAPARSEITECESLHRTEEWVNSLDRCSRDDYLKEADEELELRKNSSEYVQDCSDKTTLLLTSSNCKTLVQPRFQQLGNGYCSTQPHLTTIHNASLPGLHSGSQDHSPSGCGTWQTSNRSVKHVCFAGIGQENSSTLELESHERKMNLENAVNDSKHQFLNGKGYFKWDDCKYLLSSSITNDCSTSTFNLTDSNSTTCSAPNEKTFTSPSKTREGEEDSVFGTSPYCIPVPTSTQHRTRSTLSSGFCSQSDSMELSTGNETTDLSNSATPNFPIRSKVYGNTTGAYVVPSLLPLKEVNTADQPSFSDYINTEGVNVDFVSYQPT